MKHFLKTKTAKILLKFLGIITLFITIFAVAFYGLSSITKNNLTSQKIGLTNHDATAASQPTINDIVNEDVSSANQTIETSDSNYILPTLNSNSIPGLIKLNSFISALYGINFSSFSDYHVRQVIQNYNDNSQYFVLLVSDKTSVTATIDGSPNNNIDFSIVNPGHVLSVYDTGNSFNITADYQLDKPILDQSMFNYYSGIYFQSELTPDQTIAKPISYTLALRQGTTLPEVTPDTVNIEFWARAKWYQTPTGFIDKNTHLRHIDGTWTDYTQSVATLLYLNSLNNMVFVSDKNDSSSEGQDAIYIFGGNKYINLWFYTFYVNDQLPTTSPIVEYASGYANYRSWWADRNGGADWSTSYSSDLVTQKAYNWDLENYNQSFIDRTKSLNKYPNASFVGYYVSGAKYVKQPNEQIQLSLTIPNYALALENKLVIGTANVYFNTGNKYVQSPGITTLNLYASISTTNAIKTTGYRNDEVKSYLSNGMLWSSSSDWVPRYSNYSYNFIKVLSTTNGKASFDVTDTENDGYKAKYYNKLVQYLPEDIGNKNVSFVYERGSMSAIITEADPDKAGSTIQKTVSTPLVLQNSQTRMDDFTNIFFNGDTWFLIYKLKASNQTTVYSFKYDSETDEVTFTKTNFPLDSNLEILSILPLNKKFINVLAKDKTTNKITQLVFQSMDNQDNYSEYLPYKNLLNSNKITSQGILTYATNGSQDLYQKAVWGSVTFLENTISQETWNALNSSSDQEDKQALYKTLIQYSPGWNGQNIKVSLQKADDNSVVLSVSIEYLDGNYYSPEQLLGKDQYSKFNVLSKTYNNPALSGTIANNSSLTEALSIAIPLILISIICCVGLAFGIPYANTKHFRNKNLKLITSSKKPIPKIKSIKKLPSNSEGIKKIKS